MLFLSRLFYLAGKKLAAPLCFKLRQQTLWLSASRCIYWEEEKALILADLHFGKSGHFRGAGIGIPQKVFKEDLQKLFSQIQFFKPDRVLVVGDMFHSRENKEMQLFAKWRRDMPNVHFSLIRGNHDILPASFYQHTGIEVTESCKTIGKFSFIHDIALNKKNKKEVSFAFTGHIHPGIKLNGAGRQSLMFPCFYFGRTHAVLPAFSAFTGFGRIRPEENDHVFALVDQQVIKVQ